MAPKILIIAGSDSGAGAGLQADIKAASANGVYASTAITSVTSQNTLGVQAVYNLPPQVVSSQIESVLSDIGADVIKTGMLPNGEIISAVVIAIQRLAPNAKIICDPVMVSTSGDKLIDDSAIKILKTKLMPKSYLVTPNIPEAEVLSGLKITNSETMILAAQKIIADTNCNAVLVKGGHLKSKMLTDILVQNGKIIKLTKKRVETKNTHGTGCTYASAIASFLANGFDIEDAIKNARNYLQKTLQKSFSVGSGKSGVNHMFFKPKIDAK